MEKTFRKVGVTRITDMGDLQVQDAIAVEEPLEIRIDLWVSLMRQTIPLSITMRTPGHDEDLVIGFLLSEGMIKKQEEIVGLELQGDNILRVVVGQEVVVNPQLYSRNFYASSSCGVCGKSSIASIQIDSLPIDDGFTVSAALLESLPAKIVHSQPTFQTTGGLHASALFDAEGNLLLIREDVGRHNALDKVVGAMFVANQLPLSKNILLVSGRVSFELVQKAAVAGVPVLVAIGAPSSLAVDLAIEKGVTLVGFLKKGRFNIYTHPHRIVK
jgi:FdhD protein